MRIRPKMIALDLDGTALNAKKELTAPVRQAIGEALEQGIIVVIVTGRPFYGIPEPVMAIRGIRYFITSNGAVTYDREKRRAIHGNYLDHRDVRSILSVLEKTDALYTAFAGGYGYIPAGVYERLLARFEGTPVYAYMRQSRKQTQNLQKELQEAGTGVENVWIHAQDDQARGRILEQLSVSDSVSRILTGDRDAEFVSRQAGKGEALKWLANRIGIAMSDVMAVGDNANDIGMLTEAGIAVAMGNATGEVLARADYITATNEEDGVAKVIRRIFHPVGIEVLTE